ncbi:MAG: DUF1549 domain-containing protein [Planctomyces sp.]|nr:DUF1549 domain-containing protein [Planctomyces sp.]
MPGLIDTLTIVLRIGLISVLTGSFLNISPVIANDPGLSETLQVFPAEIRLDSPESSVQVIVHSKLLINSQNSFGATGQVQTLDRTRDANYTSADASVIQITREGLVTPVADGQTSLNVEVDGLRRQVPVIVSGISSPTPVSFQHQIMPILSKAGCNSGACHGKAEGQNGFKLSVFGYDSATDYDAIVRDGRGRRVFPADPSRSLLLLKATAVTPHGGGQKFARDSRWFRLMERWVSEGMPNPSDDNDPLVSVRVEPSEFTLAAHEGVQLRVIAVRKSGTESDVTHEADYQSNADTIAGVDRTGRVATNDVPGEAAILVRYMGHVAVSRITRPRISSPFTRPPEHNFVDTHIWNKLEHLQIPPSELSTDEEFIRRAFLDSIGTLPSVDEVREFSADIRPEKRTILIDGLLTRPEYSLYWAQRWADLLQVDKDIVTPQGAVAMTRWIHHQFSQNVPYDEFARDVITAEGITTAETPAGFFQVQSDAEKAGRAVSQLFLGVRIECAQCHHHPFERWDQADYYSFAGFFTGIDRKTGPAGAMKIVDKATAENLKHPRTSETLRPAGLGASPIELDSGLSRRQLLADWITSPDNPWFTRTIVNRLVAHYLGRGLVDPVDDLRATNPASNEPLFDALSKHMQEVKYDLRLVTRTLMTSRAYQLSSHTNAANEQDEQNYSHAMWKPIPAEVLLDAISQTTEIPEQFNGWPQGYRAIQIWDNKLPSTFMEVFGRPSRQTVCSCERGTEPSISQALHLMNSETTTRKLEDRRGRVARLAASTLSNAEILDELCLAAWSRYPTSGERELMLSVLNDAQNRQQAVEDVLWSILNSREFMFNH